MSLFKCVRLTPIFSTICCSEPHVMKNVSQAFFEVRQKCSSCILTSRIATITDRGEMMPTPIDYPSTRIRRNGAIELFVGATSEFSKK